MILITAASGRLGKAVADELALKVPVDSIRLAARSMDKLDEYKQRGFDVVKGDYDDPGTLERAFEGVDAVLLISSFGTNEERIKQHRAAVDAAVKPWISRCISLQCRSVHPL